MPPPSLTSMNLASIILMSFFYGIYFVLFATSMYLLFRHVKGVPGSAAYAVVMRSTLFISACALFIAITGFWVVTVIRCFEGFIYFKDGLDANTYFTDTSRRAETIGYVFFALALVIGDSMIIHRLWIVWSFNKTVIILPVLGLCGFIVSGVVAVQTVLHIDHARQVGLTLCTVFTIMTNVYCTALISWKIWRITSICIPVGGMNLRHFVGLIVESAAIYTSWIIFYSVTHQMKSLLQFFAVGPIPSVVGIANALIHARIGLGQTIEQIFGEQGSGESIVTAPLHFVMPRAGAGNGESGTIGTVPRPGMFFGDDAVSPGSRHSNNFSR
ncbi:hypothetical protein DFH08DRAFT_936498 [Mycena albidolilacea]|uniref:Uncharacterized protein n=1 Tax=Mycena albidolilacea TaxID=1033008 RepID=A0AAD7ERM8_9AGAR|nr:hypothetical protein DFH08DRAFT_936498 [Mycena albidolilacea]